MDWTSEPVFCLVARPAAPQLTASSWLGRKEPTPGHCGVTSTCAEWHLYAHTHSYMPAEQRKAKESVGAAAQGQMNLEARQQKADGLPSIFYLDALWRSSPHNAWEQVFSHQSRQAPIYSVATEQGQNVGALGRKWTIIGTHDKNVMLSWWVFIFGHFQWKTYAVSEEQRLNISLIYKVSPRQGGNEEKSQWTRR